MQNHKEILNKYILLWRKKLGHKLIINYFNEKRKFKIFQTFKTRIQLKIKSKQNYQKIIKKK